MKPIETFSRVLLLSSRARKNLLSFSAALLLINVSGCALLSTPYRGHSCNNQAYINSHVADYVSNRFRRENPARIGIIPFDTPANFSPLGGKENNYGRELSRKVLDRLYEKSELGIIELFLRDSWPGKREEFFSGNYEAIRQAREAGYDFVVVGYLDEVKDMSRLTLYTKLIDTENNITLWYSRSEGHYIDTTGPSLLRLQRPIKERPDMFQLSERADTLAQCVIDEMLRD